jgi:hypothetical protein
MKFIYVGIVKINGKDYQLRILFKNRITILLVFLGHSRETHQSKLESF